MSGMWHLALLIFFGLAWAAYGATHKFKRKDGEDKYITGYNWYLYYAMQFPEEQRPPFWQPPHQPGDLPTHICTYRGRWTYNNTPPTWGTESPAGYYWPSQIFNGKLTYRTDDQMWYIWWKDPTWVISNAPGFEGGLDKFYSPGAEVRDRYKNLDTGFYAKVYIGKPEE